MKIFKTGQIIMETRIYSNGRKNRTVGVIASIKYQTEGRQAKKFQVILHPVPEKLAKPIREKYCTSEFNYQGAVNCYSDKFRFACHYITPEDTVILSEGKIRGSGTWTTYYPKPGDRGYDLMC